MEFWREDLAHGQAESVEGDAMCIGGGGVQPFEGLRIDEPCSARLDKGADAANADGEEYLQVGGLDARFI